MGTDYKEGVKGFVLVFFSLCVMVVGVFLGGAADASVGRADVLVLVLVRISSLTGSSASDRLNRFKWFQTI